jgi:phage terminase large subunit-like protein
VSGVPAWLEAMVGLDDERLERMLRNAPPPLRRRLFEEWRWQAHRGQEEPTSDGPGGDWRVWLIMAGRGFGKTRAGAEWVSARAREHPDARIALVGANLDDVVKVMVEGESGLRAVARTGETVRWRPSRGLVEFSSGAQAFAYSGERPEKLRGPQHHFAWCDEIAKWTHGDQCWDNLMLGLRLGVRPRTMVTTTPRAVPVLKRIMSMERAWVSGGPTVRNVHLPEEYVGAVNALYSGTRLGRQELEGLLIEEVEGALWSRELIERCRTGPHPNYAGAPTLRPGDGAPSIPRAGEGAMLRVVIGVDPPGSVGGDACGIVAAGLGRDGTGYVLGDHTVSGRSPEGWAAAVAGAAAFWQADRVIAESNQGGAMVESVLRAADRELPLKLAHAHESKAARAEPVATLFERGRAKFAGSFPELEDELAGLTAGGGYQGPGRSPDRADAMIWAMSELMLGKARVEPRVAVL